MENGRMAERTNDEVLIRGNHGSSIVTIDSLFKKEEIEKRRETDAARRDVVYSSVVQPESLQKTIDLYKRLNVRPADKVTIVQGEEFYDCDLQSIRTESLAGNSDKISLDKGENKTSAKVVKKNAFYSSKYLIVDAKEKHFPKYLETRRCSSLEEKGSSKEEYRIEQSTSLESLHTDEFVKKWLTDNSTGMQELQRRSFPENSFKQSKENRASASDSVISTVNSVILGTLFGSKREKSSTFDSKNDLNSESSVPSRENSHRGETEMSASGGQTETDNKDALDLRLAEKDNSERERDNLESDKQPAGTMPENRETVTNPTDAKDDTKEEDLNILERERNQTNPSRMNTTVPLTDDLTDISIDIKVEDETRSPQTDVEKIPVTESGKESDLKKPKPDKDSKTVENFKECLTYSELQAFRSERDQLEKETTTGKDRM